MTKETKIGLLVGLAFIILFAIILSEKSGTRDAGLPQFAQADAARKVGPTTGTEKPLHNAGRLPVDSKLPPPVEPRPAPVKVAEAAKPAAEPAQAGKDQPLETESLARLLNPPEGSTGAAADKPREVPSVSLGEAVAIALDSAPPPIVPKAEQPAEKTASALKPADASTDLTPTEPPAAPATESPSKPASALPIKTTHEVQPGESLGKIAAKYYGRSTPQRIEAIYNANRDVIKDVNAVKANTKLSIPDLGEKSDQFEAAPGFTGTQLADARKAGFDDKVIVPLPIGDRMQPREKQRGSGGSMSRAAPAAAEKPTADKAPPEKGAVEKPAAASEKEATGKATAEKAKTAKSSAEPKTGKSPKADKNAAEKPKKDEANTAKYEWYEVQQSDTLAKIASRKLGDQKLYGEIARLNKDRIDDQNRIKPGVKLRLPVKGTTGARAESTISATSPDHAEP
ncbi:MAG TPA: LysM peptidoglycan-binding domain-containing protein [Phycisphaerae bacterium]|nr:LysM peptidoglycan-binding domain-containing protein [Phycisphaerae bacterium]